VIIDGKEWKLVPVEATQAMLDAAEKIDWSGEDVLGNCCNQWYAMLAAAPQHPAVAVEVEVTAIRQLRAQLDEYERAPVVAKTHGEYGDRIMYLYPFSDKYPPVGTELIARPAQDSPTRPSGIAAISGDLARIDAALARATARPAQTCPECGAIEVALNTPRTTYACGSSDYDQRPGTFINKCGGSNAKDA